MLFRSPYRITQVFGGDHTLTIGGKTMTAAEYYGQFGLAGHEGLDLVPTDSDWTVLALADGQVVKDNDDVRSGGYGNYVTLWHPELKKATSYGHFSENYVIIGQKVKKGDPIGKMGSSGNSTGAHVHLNLFEVDENGIRLNRNNGYAGGVDPLPFLKNLENMPAQTTDCLIPNTPEWKSKYEELVNKSTSYDEMAKDGYTSLEKIGEKIASINNSNQDKENTIKELENTIREKEETLSVLNQTIKAKNTTITTQNEEIQGKEKIINEIKMRNESLEQAGIDLIQAQKEVKELINQRNSWIEESKTIKNRIAQLKVENEKLRSGAVKELIKIILEKIKDLLLKIKGVKTDGKN